MKRPLVFSHFRKTHILLACTVLASCQPKTKSLQPIVRDITQSVYASGIVKSKDQYQVFASASGIVDTVFVKEGDLVKIGGDLAEIAAEAQELLQDNAKLAADYNSVAVNRGKLEEARAFAALAHSKMQNDSILYERQARLWAQNIGAKVTLEQARLAYENALVNEKAAVEKLTELQRQLTYLEKQSKNNLAISAKTSKDFRVQSKINGKVYQVNVRKGETVNPQIPIALVGSDREFLLEMQIDESDILLVRQGMKALVVLNSNTDSVYEAVVTRIYPVMNLQSKTFTIEAEFVKGPRALYPNISFEANVVIKTEKNALLIPREYVLNDSLVFSKLGKKIKVRTGIKDFEQVQIVSGLDANEELILPVK